MELTAPKRYKSVKFSPGTSEDGSEDEAARIASRIKKPARPQRPGHLSIQHGLSNAHLVLRRYAALDGFGAAELSDDEQEILNSPKVAPTQPVDRCFAVPAPQSLRLHFCSCHSIKASCIQPHPDIHHGSALQLCKHFQTIIRTLHLLCLCLQSVMRLTYLLHLNS